MPQLKTFAITRLSSIKLVGAFIIGLLLAGFVSTARANQDNVSEIIACANTRTGALRYLTNGRCNRRTEVRLAWNTVGQPGLAGPAGQQGPAGPAGANGQQGPAGPTGSDGSNGGTGATGPSGGFVAVDANGTQIGSLIERNLILVNSGVFYFDATTSNGYRFNAATFIYSDNTCSTPTAFMGRAGPDQRGYNTTDGSSDFAMLDRWWKPTGAFIETNTGDTVYVYGDGNPRTCTTVIIPAGISLYRTTWSLITPTDAPPTYTAPVRIEER